MEFLDRTNSYGWVSIILHWVGAISVITVWFLGDSIQVPGTEVGGGDFSVWHIGLAVGVYLLLVFRIVWRLASGHPWLAHQGRAAHLISSVVHYGMLVALAVMLVTGPLLAWASNLPLSFFGLFTIPSPFDLSIEQAALLRKIHGTSANCLMIAATVHFCGACKHLMFNDDETFIRMILPKKERVD